jgi:predicted O-methyltransferase YrrM
MSTSFPELMNEIRELLTLMPNVFYHGCVSKAELYESWKTSDVWFYPTAFSETFCVTALEAAVSKTLVVATNLAGLQHTVGNRGILFDIYSTQTQIVQLLKDTLENKELKKSLIERNYEWAKSNTWASQANQMEQYLLENKFEFRDKHHWTHDLTKRDIMIHILKKAALNNANILEIGEQTAISLIAITYEIQTTKAIVIDRWNDSLKRSFYTNLIHAEIKDRVTLIDMETFGGLMSLNKKENTFDLIFMNTISSTDMELYSELAVAWEMLNKNGVLIIELLEERKTAIWKFMKSKQTIHVDIVMAFRK